ncbi:MAG TPA: EAL domain-containing protein [Dehalococcoidia bacterium]|nr:EAL domain-containing protein [Dehalococcoidia bacterium]
MAKLLYWISSAIPISFLFSAGEILLGVCAVCLAVSGLIAGKIGDARRNKEWQEQVIDGSLRDDLTGLPNRRSFLEHLRTTLAAPLARDGHTAVFFIDLDNFKTINDTLGHSAGDQVLLEIATRLRRVLPGEHVLARMGGDEMTILAKEVTSREELVELAQRLMQVFGRPIPIRGEEVWVNGSIGIVMAPMPRPTADDFLAMADTALYNAKSLGKGQYVLFEPNLPRPTRRPLSLDADLRAAVQRDQMALYYQPIVDLRTMRVAGFEALIRWKHPRHGLLSPKEFIPLAEESGIIRTLGSWIIEKGCEQISVWQSLSGVPLTVSINLSVLQFRQRDILSHLAQTSARAGLSPGTIQLEITESILMQNDPGTHKNLQELHAMGFGIAVDDFGVGYSSLGYLKSFDVDVLKLDQSFLSDLDDPKSEALLRGAINLGRSLEVTVIAEGIENEKQLEIVRNAGCHQGQGYLLGMPMPEREVTDLLLSGALLRGPAEPEERYRPGGFIRQPRAAT